MAQSNTPYWRGLYLTGAVGVIGLVVEAVAKVRVPPQAHIMLLLGWVALVFSLISKWVIDNSAALNTMDDDAKPPAVKKRRPARANPAPACERPNPVKVGKSKNPIRRSKTI
ncbi:MAG: hypothetical protein IT324_12525 [Anaerolineae bacterium]|nr:hypothetical protein [Anaerolineae bacterium]